MVICNILFIFKLRNYNFLIMNANLLQKIVLVTSITGTALFTTYCIFKQPTVKKESIFKIRQQLLQSQDVKMLYSTMSFFYLMGFKSKNPHSFIKLSEILQIQTPNMVVVPLSKEDYESKYQKSLSHPRFRDAMNSFKFSLKNKNISEIQNVKDFNLKNLELLYLIDHCISLKTCKVVYARKQNQFYKGLQERYDKAPKNMKDKTLLPQKAKIEDYTEILIAEMKPTLKFALSPESPFKNIVGIVEPELLDGLAERWKEKFKQSYSHIVIEDEQVQKRNEEKKKKSDDDKSKISNKKV